MLGRRSFIASGVPALTALALTSCRQSSSIDSSAMKRERRAARRARAQRSDDKAQPQSLRAEWPNAIHEGDCTIQKGATFVLDINGNNQWECNVSSTDSGDDFKLSVYLDDSSFDPNSNLNVPLAIVGTYGFDIHDANAMKHWVQVFGPKAIFFRL